MVQMMQCLHMQGDPFHFLSGITGFGIRCYSYSFTYKFVYLCNLISFQNMLFLKIVSIFHIIKIIMFGDIVNILN